LLEANTAGIIHAVADTTQIGTITQGRVLAALVQSGRVVCIPFGEQPDYDLIVEDGGTFKKVQCKTGRLKGGAVHFNLYTMAQATLERRHERRPYGDKVDFYGVFCPGNGKVYLVPQEVLSTNLGVLRVNEPQNGQTKNIRWARDFEVG
jgi:hypothetical protein